MPTVLYAWELGANLGHLLPLARIARALNEDGHRAVFAVLDIGLAVKTLDPGAPMLQAPVWPVHRHFGARGAAASHADLLGAIGFNDPDKLAAMIRAWSSLVELVHPDAIVADHSPGLLVAMFEQPVPVVAVGSAFAMPPVAFDSFPPLRADSAPAIPEPRLLAAVRQAQAQTGRRPTGKLLEPFRTRGRVVFGLPELDPYRAFRQEPLAAPPGGVPPPQPWLAARRLFVYVGGEIANFETLAQALSILTVPLEVYLRGETGPVPEFLRLRGAQVHDEAPPLQEVLARCSHVLTQGGAMTAAAAFAAGRPQLVIPGHDESELNLNMLTIQGVATRLVVGNDAYATAGAITAFLDDHKLAETAQEIALRLAMRPLPDGVGVAAAAVREALATR